MGGYYKDIVMGCAHYMGEYIGWLYGGVVKFSYNDFDDRVYCWFINNVFKERGMRVSECPLSSLPLGDDIV